MGTERKLEEVATDLDDLALTLEEIKEAARDKGTTDQKTLAEVASHIEQAAEAIDEVVDPDPPRTKQ